MTLTLDCKRGVISIPEQVLVALLLDVSTVGVYSMNGSSSDLITMFVFGIVRLTPTVPLLPGLILGPLIETNMRQAVTSASSSSILVTRPVSAAILAVAVMVFFAPLVSRLIIGPPRPATWCRTIQCRSGPH